MASISVRYFALLREQAGIETENLSVTCKTYGELYSFLKEKHGFTIPLEMIQVAVNDEFSQLVNALSDNAQVVFIPPVAGG